mmetsp:Transcript_6759/g.14771  ORF Transcript_6759/g.14771 Transcript_6759/m.14771 type:complete len:359 (+) Transcript_6759:1641-2717(+)
MVGRPVCIRQVPRLHPHPLHLERHERALRFQRTRGVHVQGLKVHRRRRAPRVAQPLRHVHAPRHRRGPAAAQRAAGQAPLRALSLLLLGLAAVGTHLDRRQCLQMGPPRGLSPHAHGAGPLRHHLLRRGRGWLPRQGRRLRRPGPRALYPLVRDGCLHAFFSRPRPPRLGEARAVDLRRRDHCQVARDRQGALPAARLLVLTLPPRRDHRHARDGARLGALSRRRGLVRHREPVPRRHRPARAPRHLQGRYLRHRRLPRIRAVVRRARRLGLHLRLGRGCRPAGDYPRLPARRLHRAAADAPPPLLRPDGPRPVHPRRRTRHGRRRLGHPLPRLGRRIRLPAGRLPSLRVHLRRRQAY